MANDDETATESEEKKPSLIKKLMLPLILSVAVAGGVIGGLHFMGMLQFGGGTETAEGAEGGPESDGAAAAGDDMEASEGTPGMPAFFFTFYPDMLVTLSEGSQSHYLKLSLQVMSRDEEVVAGVEQYQPIMRNNLIKLFQEVEYDTVTGPEGLDELQIIAAEEIRRVLKKYHGKSAIEGVYFTSFVVQ